MASRARNFEMVIAEEILNEFRTARLYSDKLQTRRHFVPSNFTLMNWQIMLL